VAAQKISLLPQALKKGFPDLFVKSRRVTEKLKRRSPGKNANGYLQTKIPIETVLQWICFDPTLDLGAESIHVPLVAGQPIGNSESNKMLVPVQLPEKNEVRWARRGIQILSYATPMPEWPSPTGDGLDVPIYAMWVVENLTE
jgi:hypothetical protein